MPNYKLNIISFEKKIDWLQSDLHQKKIHALKITASFVIYLAWLTYNEGNLPWIQGIFCGPCVAFAARQGRRCHLFRREQGLHETTRRLSEVILPDQRPLILDKFIKWILYTYNINRRISVIITFRHPQMFKGHFKLDMSVYCLCQPSVYLIYWVVMNSIWYGWV